MVPTGGVGSKGQSTEAALLLFLYDAVDFNFSEFDRQRSAYPRRSGFVFAVAEFHVPSPTAVSQSNNAIPQSDPLHEAVHEPRGERGS
jgi:hypothetical protein